MLTRTTESAFMALVFLASREETTPVSPREVASNLSVSPSYLAKIFTTLVKSGILRAQRGASGGVTLDREPSTISLLEVVKTFQGPLTEEPEWEGGSPGAPCIFNRAVSQLQEQVREVLSEWTLEDLVTDPCPIWVDPRAEQCRMGEICPKRRAALSGRGG
jgi:Rrf2 family protein